MTGKKFRILTLLVFVLAACAPAGAAMPAKTTEAMMEKPTEAMAQRRPNLYGEATIWKSLPKR